MYEMKARVRYSEVCNNKAVDIAQIVNYFQDCSTFQSEDIGLGIQYLENKNRAWLLSSWQIVIERYPSFGEQIAVGTWAYDAGGLYAYRNFQLLDEQGNSLAKANSVWFFMDTEAGMPTRITEQDIMPYGKEEKLSMDYAPRKIKVPKDTKALAAFSILHMHLDTNNHVNNAKYIEIAREYLPEHFQIKQMRADYKRAAVLHDVIVPYISQDDNKYIIELKDTDNKPYVIVEFLGQ